MTSRRRMKQRRLKRERDVHTHLRAGLLAGWAIDGLGYLREGIFAGGLLYLEVEP